MVLLIGVRPKPGFGHFEVPPWVKFSKFWPEETSDLHANGPESFPPGFFTTFWRAMAGNYESVFLTIMRPNGAFDRYATKTRVRSFWGATMSQIFEILTWRDFGSLCQWSRKFPSWIFYHFLADYGWKLQIGLFDRRATKIYVGSIWSLWDQERPQKSTTSGG